MFRMLRLSPAVLVFALNISHALPGEGSLGQTTSTATSCEPFVLGKPIDATRALIVKDVGSEFERVIINLPIEIIKGDYKGMLGSERTRKQDELAKQGGELLAKEILKISNLADDQANVAATMVIQRLGEIPQGSLTSFKGILTASLSSLESPDQQPTFEKNTRNALEELTRVVTSYRKNAFDFDMITNLLFKLGWKDQSRYVRSRFHSVQSAAAKIDDTLETALAKMFERHYQMLDARLQLKAFERYAELCTSIGLEAKKLIEEYMDENQFNADQRAAMDKNVLVPLTARVPQIVRSRASVGLSFNQFALLMDSNLSLISVIANIRETASLDITTFGAASIIANEQAALLSLANSTTDALDELRNESIARLKQNGIMMRQVPQRQIESMDQMVDQVVQLYNELVVARDFNRTTVEKYSEAIARITPKLDQIADDFDRALSDKRAGSDTKASPIQNPNILTEVNEDLKGSMARTSTDLDKMPPPVQPLQLPAPQ